MSISTETQKDFVMVCVEQPVIDPNHSGEFVWEKIEAGLAAYNPLHNAKRLWKNVWLFPKEDSEIAGRLMTLCKDVHLGFQVYSVHGTVEPFSGLLQR